MTRWPNRRGVATLLALWTVVAAGSMAAMGMARAAESIRAAENRIELLRASWSAEGCVNQLLATLDRRLIDATEPGEAWDHLDGDALVGEGCEMSLEPSGLTIDVNQASYEELSDALTRLSAVAGADSLAAAIVDWRDADDEVLAAGAERGWYVEHGMMPPRNAPFMAREELTLVRGANEYSGILAHLGVEHARILLSRAPEAVIATVPGMPPEAVRYLVSAQRQPRYPSLETVMMGMPPEVRSQLEKSLPALKQLTTITPDTWLLTARAIGKWGLEATVEVRLARDGTRLSTVRRRCW